MPIDSTKGNIIIVSMHNPTIFIDIPLDQKCCIKDVNLSHCGFHEDS